MDSATAPADQPSEEQHHKYLALAETALQQYALGPTTPTFIQHNAGIVFRVEAPMMGQPYLLAISAQCVAARQCVLHSGSRRKSILVFVR
jgi:hypothetical protein